MSSHAFSNEVGPRGASAKDLRTVVARRVGSGRKVALLSSDEALASMMRGNDCEMIIDPPSLEALNEFAPQTVVAFDGFAAKEPVSAFRALAAAAPDAEVLFSFANASSASSLLAGLSGASTHVAFSEQEVLRWLNAAGYEIVSKEPVVTAHRGSGLAADTETALRQLFEQLNPSAGVDRFLLVAKRGATASATDLEDAVTSVIVFDNADDRLQGTLRSVAHQRHRPLEIVVASTRALEALDPCLAELKAKPGITTVSLPRSDPSFAVSANRALTLAHGRFLAFARAGDLFAPMHFSQLTARLREGTQAWALPVPASLRTAQRAPQFSLGTWLNQRWVAPCEWLIDRTRLGPFALRFAEGVSFSEALLFSRLALLFAPLLVHEAPSTNAVSEYNLDLDAFIRSFGGRPLRGLTPLDALIDSTRPAALVEAVRAQLAALDPRTLPPFDRALSTLRRVQRAWDTARKQAEHG